MSKQLKSHLSKFPAAVQSVYCYVWGSFRSYWQRGWWQKTVVLFIVTLSVLIGGMYGIARWYIAGQQGKPQVIGTSFIPAYAESFGLDAEETLQALIDDLGIRHFRLVSYWNQLEPEQGKYNFDLLDWQFAKAEKAGAKITLSVGLRQPRWPECHMPAWANAMPESEWQPKLEDVHGRCCKPLQEVRRP